MRNLPLRNPPYVPAKARLDVPVPGRVCWSCRYVRYTAGEYGYSEYTPGYDFSLGCGKEYWEFDNYVDNLADFRAKLQAAELCSSFKEHKKETKRAR